VDQLPVELLERWRNGDQQAADELFGLYADRLVVLARSGLSARLKQRLDPEDVVQSAYRSFFRGASAGRFEIKRGGDLWRLLVAITLNKLHLQVRRNQAGKRAVARERKLADSDGGRSWESQLLAREPSPLEAVTLTDEVEKVIRQLEPLERQMLELRLQGTNVERIAAVTHRTERTVRRVLEQVKNRLEARLSESSTE
jgi:RNA polymerase sigma-70 factor (ECF subfamily)